MSEDVPMRNQRGNLRNKGLSFLSDNQDKIGFYETEDLSINNVDGRDYFLSKGETNIDIKKQKETFRIKDLSFF